jgi:mono/diheme cytochrome c family protein
VVIADLRAARLQRHLHRTADLRNSLPALALEVEIGLILAHARAVRPERQDAFALAYYVWTLADAFAAETARRQPAPQAFARHCAPCHKDPAFAGDSLPADFMQRPVANLPGGAGATARLRTPALLGVSARRWLLYGGEADGIDGLLDPRRTRGGHSMTGRLDDDERKAIADYLKAL